MAEPGTPLKGTRPVGAHTEAEAARQVREMFSRIAPRYDFLNHLLSLELDRLWRWRVTRRLRPIVSRPESLVLDLCCGTGDLALALTGAGPARVIGADFAHAMLVRAKAKATTAEVRAISLFEADALHLPFADASFDLVTTAFGFRNLANYEAGLREILRILKPGGTLAILEFAEPRPGWFGALYRWYSSHILPRLGRAISGDRWAYAYLPASVSRFFRPEELSALLGAAGYEQVRCEVWTGGTVAFHRGMRRT